MAVADSAKPETGASATPAGTRLLAGGGAMLLMAVLLFVVPLALESWVAPQVSLLALMAADATLVAVLARGGASIGVALALFAMLALAQMTRAHGWVAVPSIGMFMTLFGWFAVSLRRGSTPVITRIAAQVHLEGMSTGFLRYTRGLTLAWAVFFGAMAIASALLARHASFALWSMFVNLLSWPLIGAMFVAEYFVRRTWFAQLPATRPAQIIAAALRFGAPLDAQGRAQGVVRGHDV